MGIYKEDSHICHDISDTSDYSTDGQLTNNKLRRKLSRSISSNRAGYLGM